MVYTVSITEVKERINYYKNILPEYNIRIGLSPRLDTRDVIIDLKQIEVIHPIILVGME